MFSLLALVGIGSTFFGSISGLTLTSSNKYVTTKGFDLTCNVQGAITTQLSVKDPLGAVAAACFQPPGGCASTIGNGFDRKISDGTFTVSVVPNNIHVTNHIGNWTCTNGINVAWFEVKEIVSITTPVIQSEEAIPITGTVIRVLIGCIYPYPDEVKISYVKKSSPSNVLKSRNDVKFDNGTSSNCEFPDSRAISMNGSFLASTDQLKGEEALIAATVLLNGIVLDIGYSNFTIHSKKDCSQDIFLYGFLPVFLIVLIASIAIIIILKIECLPRQFGEFIWKKVGITAVFCVIAIIIGVCLGLLIKGCDKKLLALGLSLFFGILLVVALIFALIYYHKKCESGSGS